METGASMPKKKTASEGKTQPTFTRLDDETRVGMERLAQSYECTVSDLLRSAAKEMVSGEYLPGRFNPDRNPFKREP